MALHRGTQPVSREAKPPSEAREPLCYFSSARNFRYSSLLNQFSNGLPVRMITNSEPGACLVASGRKRTIKSGFGDTVDNSKVSN